MFSMIDPNDAETLDPDDFDTIGPSVDHSVKSSNTVEPDKAKPYAGHELEEPFDPDETIDMTETLKIIDGHVQRQNAVGAKESYDPDETWDEGS
jgi:hypothetical protein